MNGKQGYAHLQRVMVGIARPGSLIMEEAAKEIERLQAELEEARDLCRNWAESFGCAAESDFDMCPWLVEE